MEHLDELLLSNNKVVAGWREQPKKPWASTHFFYVEKYVGTNREPIYKSACGLVTTKLEDLGNSEESQSYDRCWNCRYTAIVTQYDREVRNGLNQYKQAIAPLPEKSNTLEEDWIGHSIRQMNAYVAFLNDLLITARETQKQLFKLQDQMQGLSDE